MFRDHLAMNLTANYEYLCCRVYLETEAAGLADFRFIVAQYC